MKPPSLSNWKKPLDSDSARELLERFKKKEFSIDHRSEKIQTSAAVRKVIEDYLYMKLPYPSYDDDISLKAEMLFNDFKERYADYGQRAA